jgi:hypothetical protein
MAGNRARKIDPEAFAKFVNGQGDPPRDEGDDYVEPKLPEFAIGQSIHWYAKQPINENDTLLGNRYLCRTGGMFVIAPSGMGKSTLSIQFAILWCCGLSAFGIKPKKALRILLVQSEDDQGDCTEMSKMIDHLELNDEEKARVDENSELVRCNHLVGYQFIQALRSRLQNAKDKGKPFDLVIINPYGVYLGADVKDTEACTQFLNQWLNPVLNEFNVATILIHHTPKTNFQNTDNYNIWDWMYYGAGCACITNWARAILVMKPEKDLKMFRFIAAKRGSRIGDEWENSFERYFAWSSKPGVLRWENVPTEQAVEQMTKPGRKSVNLDVALKQVPVLDAELKEKVITKIQNACEVGHTLAKNALAELILTEKAFDIPLENPGKGRSFAGVRQLRPGSEQEVVQQPF